VHLESISIWEERKMNISKHTKFRTSLGKLQEKESGKRLYREHGKFDVKVYQVEQH
jgi:hypothetical protein